MAQPKRKNALPQGTVLRDCYRIESVLGAGGFALTYLGRHTGLDHKVAVKEYLPDQFGLRDEDGTAVSPRTGAKEDFDSSLKRFSDEARTLAKFKHPGIVPVTDIFEANGTAYMVMEYVEGESLQERLTRAGPLPEPEFRTIFEPILQALAEVHAHGFLHRDIKPANIYVRADGSPVLLDFGSSREALGDKVKDLTVMLTPGYAPNEQYSSRGKQGPWTDIYSLGATMYVAIMGTAPPEAPDRALEDEYVKAGAASKKVRQGYAPALLEAVDRALALRPEDRPQDIAEFQELLGGQDSGPRTILPRNEAIRRTGSTMPRAAKQPRKAWATTMRSLWQRLAPAASASELPWRRLAIAASVLVLLGGGGAFGWIKYQEAETSRLAAEAEKIRLAVEKARAEAEGRNEAERFERAAVEATRRAEEATRRAARWRRIMQQRRAEEARRQQERRPIKADTPKKDGPLDGVKEFFEKILP